MPKTYRALALNPSGGSPATLDVKARSMEVVCATENRVQVFDYERWQAIDEVLLMAGCRIPDNGQVPLLDSHDRRSTVSVVGSCRDLKIVGKELIGRAHFAEVPEAESSYAKVRDGHITDFSIGYRVEESYFVPEGEAQIINNQAFTGPVRVATKWSVKELSVCPIGADEAAKARAEANIPLGRDANPAPQQNKENTAMDKQLRAFLESRGLSTTATEEEAQIFFRKLSAEPPLPAGRSLSGAEGTPVDVDTVVRKAIDSERARHAEIMAMGSRFGCQDLTSGLSAAGDSVEAARAKVMEHLATQQEGKETPNFRTASVGPEARDKFRNAAQDAICLRAGIVIAAPAVGAEDLRGYSLKELARQSLVLANAPSGGNPMEMIGRAMTTGDLPSLLSNVASRSLAAGYETSGETWQDWCGVGSVSDFKTHDLVSVSETEDLDQITEAQPYEYGKRTDAKEQYSVATYGKLFAITRQTIINDDLAALTDIPRAHGEAAARKIGDVAYAVLTANAAMRDTVALFHANHGNLGTAAVVSEVTIGEAIKLMKLQKDLLGKRRLNIRPEFFLAPVTLEGHCEIFFNTNQYAGDLKSATRTNPYAGSRFTRVYEPRLDDASATAYYLAGPKGKTVTVFFLNGQQAPYMETKQGWGVDGVEYKVRIDCGAKAVDWKALLKNAGA